MRFRSFPDFRFLRKKLTLSLLLSACCLSTAILFSAPVRSNLGGDGEEYGDAAAPTAADYIQDGLIVLLDGIENVGWGIHDEESTIWVDLISGEEHAVVNRTFTEDGLLWSNNSTLTLKPSLTMGQDFFSSDKTVEFCGETNPTTYNNIGLSGQSMYGFQQTVYGTAPNRYANTNVRGYDIQAWMLLRTYELDGVSPNVKHRTSLVLNNSYLRPYYEGLPMLYHRKATIPAYTSGFTSFVWAGAKGCKARCIRIYNRALSPEEIAYNYLIDKARFAL